MLSINKESWGWHMPHVDLRTVHEGSVVTDPGNPSLAYMVTDMGESRGGWITLERLWN